MGTYDPIASKDGVKEVRVKMDRMKYWLSVGAQPSDIVARLLGHLGVLPQPPIRFQPKKSQVRGVRVGTHRPPIPALVPWLAAGTRVRVCLGAWVSPVCTPH